MNTCPRQNGWAHGKCSDYYSTENYTAKRVQSIYVIYLTRWTNINDDAHSFVVFQLLLLYQSIDILIINLKLTFIDKKH